MLALATIYDGGTRWETTRLSEVSQQIVRDQVMRLNTEGPEAARPHGTWPDATVMGLRLVEISHKVSPRQVRRTAARSGQIEPLRQSHRARQQHAATTATECRELNVMEKIRPSMQQLDTSNNRIAGGLMGYFY
jgi:hypothetical protein